MMMINKILVLSVVFFSITVLAQDKDTGGNKGNTKFCSIVPNDKQDTYSLVITDETLKGKIINNVEKNDLDKTIEENQCGSSIIPPTPDMIKEVTNPIPCSN